MSGPTRLGREALSLLGGLGWIAPPARPFGITAIMRVKNEEDWLEISAKSLAGFADQVVIGDNGSSDGTPRIIAKLKREYPELIESLELPNADILDLTNRLIERARYRWIFKWDGDFLAQTSGPYRITRLKEWLATLSPRRYYFVYPRMVELAGDLWHQDPAHPTRADAHLWTASERLRYVRDPAGYEAPLVSAWYGVRRFDTPCFYHLHVKSNDRLFYNHLWKRYLIEPDKAKRGGFAEYCERTCREEFGHEDLKRAAREWMRLYVRRLTPFDVRRFPDYPELLRPHLEKPKYRIRYENDKIAERVELSCP